MTAPLCFDLSKAISYQKYLIKHYHPGKGIATSAAPWNTTWRSAISGRPKRRSTLWDLGIEKERIKMISYGKEMPLDNGHDETAWAKNRRAHFVIFPPPKN